MPHIGLVKYNDVNSEHLNINNIRNQILSIFADEHLPNTSVINYITMWSYTSLLKWQKQDVKHGLTALLTKNGIKLNDSLSENGSLFSQGQRQLIKLMRIFAEKHQLLILDEALEYLS